MTKRNKKKSPSDKNTEAYRQSQILLKDREEGYVPYDMILTSQKGCFHGFFHCLHEVPYTIVVWFLFNSKTQKNVKPLFDRNDRYSY